MSRYPLLRLRDVARVVAGDPAPQDPRAFGPDGPLFIRMQDVGRHHLHPELSDSADRINPNWLRNNRLRLFPKGSVLIPKSGASVNLNHRAKLGTDAHVVSHLAVLTPDTAVIEPDYLYWWSVRFDPRAQAQVTSLPSLKLATLKEAEVPLPPLHEQRRIVDILNCATKVETLQRRAAVRLREFVSALFVRMFGDPVENRMGWAVRPLADLVNEFRYGTSRKCYDVDDGEDDLPILRVPNILPGCVDWTNLKFTSLRGRERTNLSLERGDLLFVRTNGNPAYIGRCAVFRERRQAAYASYLIRARLNSERAVDPEYVSAALALPTMRQTLLRMARTTAGNYNISIDLLGHIRIPVPTPRLQQEFSAIIARTRETLDKTETSIQTSLDLSQSLMARLLGDHGLPDANQSVTSVQLKPAAKPNCGSEMKSMKRNCWTPKEQRRQLGSAMLIATTANLLLGLRSTEAGRQYADAMVTQGGMDRELCEAGTNFILIPMLPFALELCLKGIRSQGGSEFLRTHNLKSLWTDLAEDEQEAIRKRAEDPVRSSDERMRREALGITAALRTVDQIMEAHQNDFEDWRYPVEGEKKLSEEKARLRIDEGIMDLYRVLYACVEYHKSRDAQRS